MQFSNSTIQQFNNSTIQQFNNSAIQQFSNSAIQQFNNSAIQQFSNSAIQQFSNSAIQQFIVRGRSPTPPQHSGEPDPDGAHSKIQHHIDQNYLEIRLIFVV